MPQKANSTSTVEHNDETYEQLAAKLSARKDQRLIELFEELNQAQAAVDQLDREILKVAGTSEERDRHMLVIAAKKAGSQGIALDDLRRLIRDPNDLNKARKALREPKDEEGNTLPAIIREERVKLEIRVYAIEESSDDQVETMK